MKTRDSSRYDQWVNLMDIFRDVTDLKTGTGAPGAEVMADAATAKKARHFSGAVTEPWCEIAYISRNRDPYRRFGGDTGRFKESGLSSARLSSSHITRFICTPSSHRCGWVGSLGPTAGVRAEGWFNRNLVRCEMLASNRDQGALW